MLSPLAPFPLPTPVCVCNWENRNEFSVTSTSVFRKLSKTDKTRRQSRRGKERGGGRRSIGYTAWLHCVCVFCVCVLGYVLCYAVLLFTCLARFILYCRSALVQGFCQIKANKGRAFCFPADDATSLNRYLSHSVSVAVRLSVGLSVCVCFTAKSFTKGMGRY